MKTKLRIRWRYKPNVITSINQSPPKIQMPTVNATGRKDHVKRGIHDTPTVDEADRLSHRGRHQRSARQSAGVVDYRSVNDSNPGGVGNGRYLLKIVVRLNREL